MACPRRRCTTIIRSSVPHSIVDAPTEMYSGACSRALHQASKEDQVRDVAEHVHVRGVEEVGRDEPPQLAVPDTRRAVGTELDEPVDGIRLALDVEPIPPNARSARPTSPMVVRMGRWRTTSASGARSRSADDRPSATRSSAALAAATIARA
jgi:hypothetical protein